MMLSNSAIAGSSSGTVSSSMPLVETVEATTQASDDTVVLYETAVQEFGTDKQVTMREGLAHRSS